jgi:transposase
LQAAKRDQLRARHRLSKFLLRHGRRAPEGTNAWTDKHLQWIKSQVHFEHRAQEITLGDYLHEVDHVAERIARLERSIDAVLESLPVKVRAVIEALKSCAGSHTSAPCRSWPSWARCRALSIRAS